MTLETNTKLYSLFHRIYTVDKKLAAGGQGSIYSLKDSPKQVAKIYAAEDAEKQRKQLQKLEKIQNIQHTLPENFIRIQDILTKPQIGYIMENVSALPSVLSKIYPAGPNEHKPADFQEWKIWFNKWGLEKRLLLGWRLAGAFRQLHQQNLTYGDLSASNVLIWEVDGQINAAVIDIDNIYVAASGILPVLGTPGYMAPEVLEGQPIDPAAEDWSLAVLLFQLLRLGHPFRGSTVINAASEQLEADALAGKTQYVSDEDPALMPAEYVCTEKLKQLFYNTFAKYKNRPLARSSASDFEQACLEAYYNLIECPVCGNFHFPYVVPDTKHKQETGKDKNISICPWCQSQDGTVRYLRIFTACLGPNGAIRQIGSTSQQIILKKGLQNIDVHFIYPWKHTDQPFLQFNYTADSKRSAAANVCVFNPHNSNAQLYFNTPNGLQKTSIPADQSKAILLHSGNFIVCTDTIQTLAVENGGPVYTTATIIQYGRTEVC